MPDPRRTVLEGQRVLERTADSIARSTAIAIETEQIGTEVVGELGTQRETLQRTKGRLHDTGGWSGMEWKFFSGERLLID